MISKSLWKINEIADDQHSSAESKQSEPMEEEYVAAKSQLEFKPPVIEEIEEEDDNTFNLVGPQAPALSNRLRGKKTFDFGFVAEKKPDRNREIMEEEKTTEPIEPFSGPISLSAPVIENPIKKK